MKETNKQVEVSKLVFDNEPYIVETQIRDLLLISRPFYPDPRGSFQENFRIPDIGKNTGLEISIKQSSISEMLPGTLRGIHCERQYKILTPISGEFLFTIVDLRSDSETFKKWLMFKLDANQGRRYTLFIPEGCGNSMLILGNNKAILQYLVTSTYQPDEAKRVVRYNDPDLAIPWPIKNPIISERDLEGLYLREFLIKYHQNG